jgi:hypothetical protein
MTRLRAELTSHCGGRPSVVQRALIERAVWLSLRLAQLDRKIAGGQNFTEIDSNTYLAWNNSLVRTLARLGIEPKQSNGYDRDLVMAELEELSG